jgi:hypothetical protein
MPIITIEKLYFGRNSKSKRGNNSNKMLDGVVFSCQQIGVNTFYKHIRKVELKKHCRNEFIDTDIS